MKTRLCLLASLAAFLVPGAARAFTFGVEVSPGVAIPVSKLIDGLPLDDNDPDWGKVTYRLDLTNKPGFNAGLGLLFNQFEFRYTFMMLPFDRLQLTHIMFHKATDKFYFPISALKAAGVVDPAASTSWDISGELKSAKVHAFTFGYRFEFLDGVFRPYIPVAAWFALGQLEGEKPLPGFIFQMGLGAEYRITQMIAVGACARYNWIAVRNPRTFGESLKQVGADALKANDTLFGTVLESVQVVTVQANGTFRF